MRGTLGKLTKQYLMKEQTEDEMETDESFTFKRATSERFVISGTDIGDLISLEIEVYNFKFLCDFGDLFHVNIGLKLKFFSISLLSSSFFVFCTICDKLTMLFYLKV